MATTPGTSPLSTASRRRESACSLSAMTILPVDVAQPTGVQRPVLDHQCIRKPRDEQLVLCVWMAAAATMGDQPGPVREACGVGACGVWRRWFSRASKIYWLSAALTRNIF